jgi:uncharacterized flavoprotein (TIGR03862 family)
MGVTIWTRHRWLGWDRDGFLQFQTPDGALAIRSDCTILALGGASGPQLGSDGAWAVAFQENGVGVAPLRPSNCGFLANWSEHFRERFAGQPLKNVGLGFGETRIRGEAMITTRGIEGGGIYALSPELRGAIEAAGEAMLFIDLAPDTSQDVLASRLTQPRGKRSLSNWLRKQARLQPVEAALLHEAALAQGNPLAAMTPEALAALIKAVPVRLTGTAPIERAISTAGGIAFAELDEQFMLKTRPGTFVAGEMLNWEAPTGGYLLQAVFATGAAAGRGALRWLGQTATAEPQVI